MLGKNRHYLDECANLSGFLCGPWVAASSLVDAQRINEISLIIVQAAIEVHRTLGPGLLERVYYVCLCYELRQRGLNIVTELVLPIHYKNERFDINYRIDILVEGEIIIEVKSVEAALPVHYAQLLSYLRLADKRLGIFLNFNVPVMVKGVKRIVNGL